MKPYRYIAIGYQRHKGETMKIVGLLFAFFSASTFAMINDFECNFEGQNGENVKVEVERSLGQGFKRVNLSVESENEEDIYDYYTTAQIDNMNRIQYWGGGMELEIDLWPNRRPQYGRIYRSLFSSLDLNNGHRFYNIYCQYTGF